MSNIDITCVIIHYGDFNKTINSIRSLIEDQSTVCRRILVYQNSILNGESNLLFNEIVYIMGDGKNIGFSPAVNICIEKAFELNSRYVLLLNNDAVVISGCLDTMVKVMDADSRLGITSPQIVDANTNDLWFSGGVVDVFTWNTIHRDGDIGPKESRYITGCAMFLNVTMLKEIGFLDEKLWMYYEDVDISIRANKQGWGLHVVSERLVLHWVSQGSAGNENFTRYWYARNSIIMAKKWGTAYSVIFIVIMQLKRVVTNLISHFILGRNRPWKGQLKGTIIGCFSRATHNKELGKNAFLVKLKTNLNRFSSVIANHIFLNKQNESTDLTFSNEFERPKKLLAILVGACPPSRGGIIDYGWNLASQLSKLYRVKLWSTTDTTDEFNNYCIVASKVRLKGSFSSFVLSIRILLSGARTLLIQEDPEGEYWKYSMIVVCLLARLYGIRTIAIIHEVDARRYYIMNFLAHFTVLVDENWTNLPWPMTKRCRVVSLPPNIPRAGHVFDKPNEIIIGVFGFFSSRKQPLRLANAAVNLVNAGHDVTINYIGEIPKTELASTFVDILLNGKVEIHVTGYLEPNSIGVYLERSSVNVILYNESAKPRFASFKTALQQSPPVVTVGPLTHKMDSVVEVSVCLTAVEELASAILTATSLPRIWRNVPTWDESIKEYQCLLE